MSERLAQQQARMLAALWAPNQAAAVALLMPSTSAAGALGPAGVRGLAAYRSHAAALAPRVLRSAYPVVAELIGVANFEPLSRRFWAACPPERGDLAQWGEALPAYIESLAELSAAEPYLADVARVEWALHAAATAADAPAQPDSFQRLASCDPATLGLQLSPGLQLVASAYPVASIVTAHRDGAPTLDEAGRLLRAGTPETAVVWRDGWRPRLRQALPGEAAFVRALQENRPLPDSLTAAPGLDLAQWLAQAVRDRLLLAVHLR